jgi:PilZ domain
MLMTIEKPTAQQINRRASRRFSICSYAKVECRKGSYGFGANLLLSVENLSETGTCLNVKSAVGKGEEVEVLFAGLDAGRAMKRLGRVVWCKLGVGKTWSIGVQFQSPLPYNSIMRIVRQS